ncbi:MAG: DNA polymerase IV [Candidatus Paceibacterota bacterium]
MPRIVMHLDMDAFFAAVEERDRPRLKGRPIVIGSDPLDGKGRGVVSTANYVARTYGIRSALPISRAWTYSQKAKTEGKPEAVFIAPNIKKYAAESEKIFAYIKRKVDKLQIASIDEAYADISSTKTFSEAKKLAQQIKAHIKRKHKLTASIGIGPNRLIAKIASDEEKPDGLIIIQKKDVQNFLDPKNIRTIPGIGPKAEQALNNAGIKTIKELRTKFPQKELEEKFGKRGAEWYDKARGEDESKVEQRAERKSIGEECTFQEDTLDSTKIVEEFQKLIRSVSRTVNKKRVAFKTVAIKVRFEDFQTLTRAHTLERETNKKPILETEALQLLMPFLDSRENPRKKKIRLIGLRVEKLSKNLFT